MYKYVHSLELSHFRLSYAGTKRYVTIKPSIRVEFLEYSVDIDDLSMPVDAKFIIVYFALLAILVRRFFVIRNE